MNLNISISLDIKPRCSVKFILTFYTTLSHPSSTGDKFSKDVIDFYETCYGHHAIRGRLIFELFTFLCSVTPGWQKC
jgi:hypothetical protein